MKNYTVKCKVILEVEVPIELEEQDTVTPEQAAIKDLKDVSIRDWYQRLSADYEIGSIQVTEVASYNHSCEECGVVLTMKEWPEDESCPICNPEELGGIFGSAIDEPDWEAQEWARQTEIQGRIDPETCVHQWQTNSMFDMQAICIKCGVHKS